MKSLLKSLIVYFIILCLLFGCSVKQEQGKSDETVQNSSEKNSVEKKLNVDEINVEPLPTTYEELA